jgi:hypothetical protein
LESRSRTRKPERGGWLAQVHDQVAGLLGGPRRGRVRGDAEDMHPAAGDLHDEQDIQPAQRDGVEVEEVGGQQPRRLSSQEPAPARVHLARCRPDSAGGEDTADRAGTHSMTEPDQLSLDSSMSPGRVLPRQAQDQVADVVADPWAAGSVRIGPASGHQAAVPTQQRGRGDDAVLPQLKGQGTDQGRQDRSVRPRQSRLPDLAAKYCDLMPKHHQLGEHPRLTPRHLGQPAEDPNRGEVEQPNDHERDPRRQLRTRRSHAVRAVLARHTVRTSPPSEPGASA